MPHMALANPSLMVEAVAYAVEAAPMVPRVPTSGVKCEGVDPVCEIAWTGAMTSAMEYGSIRPVVGGSHRQGKRAAQGNPGKQHSDSRKTARHSGLHDTIVNETLTQGAGNGGASPREGLGNPVEWLICK